MQARLADVRLAGGDSMTWTNPNWLWALAAVAAAALLTLLRPARRLLVVGSLEL